MEQRWFKSEPLALTIDRENIDRDAGIIRNVIMAQAGPAKGHGVWLEESFIDQLVAYDQKHFSTNGLKARFGHPAMSDTTMGTQMGYFRNFRKEGTAAVADLHLLEAADKSPSKPGMREWMLSMAEEATDFVMSSIVFNPSGGYQYSPETGERVDFEGNTPPFERERVFVDFDATKGAAHYYTDLVESGAATDKLFSTQFNRDKFAVRVVEFLEENDDVLQFIRSNPDKIIEMCEKLHIPINIQPMKAKTEKSFLAHIASFFGAGAEDAQPDAVATAEEQPETQDTPDSTVDAPENTELSEMRVQLQQLAEANAALAKQVTELRKKPVAEPTSTVEVPGAAGSESRYMCETTMQSMRR